MKKQFTLLLMAGALSLAACLPSIAGTVKITGWLIAGPFTADKTTDLLSTPFINEPDAAPAEGEAAVANQWKKVNGPYINFLKTGFLKTENCTAYAFSYVYSQSDQLAVMYFGSDDGAAIWLNGSKVLDKQVRRSMVENQDTVRIFIGRGWNRLLFKIDQGGGDWSMVCSLNARDVKFSQERPATGTMAVSRDLVVTGVDISVVDTKNVSLVIGISNYGKAELTRIQPLIVDAGGKTVARARVVVIPAGRSAGAETVMGIPALCRLLSQTGAGIRMDHGGQIIRVDIPEETSLDLFLKLISNRDIAGEDISGQARNLGNAIMIYGPGGDHSQLARNGLAFIADGKMAETKPVLEEMERSILMNAPDLRGTASL